MLYYGVNEETPLFELVPKLKDKYSRMRGLELGEPCLKAFSPFNHLLQEAKELRYRRWLEVYAVSKYTPEERTRIEEKTSEAKNRIEEKSLYPFSPGSFGNLEPRPGKDVSGGWCNFYSKYPENYRKMVPLILDAFKDENVLIVFKDVGGIDLTVNRLRRRPDTGGGGSADCNPY